MIRYANEELKELYQLHVVVFGGIYLLVDDSHLAKIKENFLQSYMYLTSNSLEHPLSRNVCESFLLLILHEYLHDAFQVELKHLINAILPAVFVSKGIQTRWHGLVGFVFKARHDELSKQSLQVLAVFEFFFRTVFGCRIT